MKWATDTYRGRCKTGWRIRRDDRTGRWEAYNRGFFDGPPVRFATWRRAVAYVQASTYGRHDRATVPTGLRDFYKLMFPVKNLPKHRKEGDSGDMEEARGAQRRQSVTGETAAKGHQAGPGSRTGMLLRLPPHLLGDQSA